MAQGERAGMNVCAVVFLSVLLLVAVEQAGADFGWLSGSASDVVLGWTRGESVGSGSLDASTRRVLASSGSYIGYGALTAGRVPCPPRSGRSYYTPNCKSASGPVRPYKRGCSRITRCARG